MRRIAATCRELRRVENFFIILRREAAIGMSNEELTISIQSGDDTLFPQLWEQTRRFIYQAANRYYIRYEGRCIACGLTIEDLQQEAYFALMDAVRAWTPESGYKLLTYLNYPLKNCFNGLCGLRVRKRDALDRCSSLDAPVGDDDSTFTLAT